MPRLRPQEAEELFFEAPPPKELVEYDPTEHTENMKDLVPGMIGAALRLKLRSISGPEIGSPLPVVATLVPRDLIRILVDPTIVSYKRKGREFVRLDALSYQGELLVLDTADLYYGPFDEVTKELLYQKSVLEGITLFSLGN